MAFWDDIYNACVSAVETVAEAVETAVNAVAEVVADIVETIGNGIQDACNAAGGGGNNGVGGGILAWLGSVIAGACNLVAATVKGALNIVGGAAASLIKIVGAVLLLNGPLLLSAAIDLYATLGGGIMSTGASLVELGQRLLYQQSFARPLTKAERVMLKDVFQNSLSLYNIRIVDDRSGLFGLNPQAVVTINNTIYFGSVSPAQFPHVLVHECVHVWQYQNGGSRYMLESVVSQLKYANASRDTGAESAYDWTLEPQRGRQDWEDFNLEAQASLIEDIWKEGAVETENEIRRGSGIYFSPEKFDSLFHKAHRFRRFFISVRDASTDNTQLANAAITSLRLVNSIRFSNFFHL